MFKRIDDDSSLVGRWAQTSPAVGPNQKIEVVFTPDRKLTYIVSEPGGRRIINLTYEVSGGTLITDQPSEPRKEYTKFEFTSEDVLVLDYCGERTVFRREK